jgi:hypothetical protein
MSITCKVEEKDPDSDSREETNGDDQSLASFYHGVISLNVSTPHAQWTIGTKRGFTAY